MKNSEIKEHLARYNRNKGLGRTLLWDEPHIKKLQEFVLTIDDDLRVLNTHELFKLVNILLEKNDRDSESQSSQIFKLIIHKLGGYKALDYLKNNHLLAGDLIRFLEKHYIYADKLALRIKPLSISLTFPQMQMLLTSLEKMDDSTQAVKSLKWFKEKLPEKELYLNVLEILSKYSYFGENAEAAFKVDDIKFSLELLQAIEQSNPELLHQSPHNIQAIFKLKHPNQVLALLKLIPIRQNNLDVLYAIEEKLEHPLWLADIIGNFATAEWPIDIYLNRILSHDQFAIKIATDKLVSLKLPRKFESYVLDYIFTYPGDPGELTEALLILNEIGLNKEDLELIFAAKNSPEQIANTIVLLKHENFQNEYHKKLLCTQLRYNIELAHFFIALKVSNYELWDAHAMMLINPECADMAVKIIKYLREFNLDNQSNISAVCQAKLTSDSLLNLLGYLNKAHLLNPLNVTELFKRLVYIETLEQAAKSLTEGDKLDQLNFHTILIDPQNALSLSEEMLKPKVLEAIRQSAKALVSPRNQMGVFYPPKAAPKEIAGNSFLIKIAQGVEEIEPGTYSF